MASVTQEQYIRDYALIVSTNRNGAPNGLDLSDLKFKFSVKRTTNMTPNTAEIRVYNVSETTALQIKKEFNKVTLQAGYIGNSGVIFQGNIKQVILGRESATDTFVDIIASDGDLAYNFSVVRQTLAAGTTQEIQVNTAAQAMNTRGVTLGPVGEMPKEQLPRGKVMFGASRDYLRDVANNTGKQFSIQNEQVTFIKNTSYLPGDVVDMNSKTGMIGTPQQTNYGVNLKCLINPRIKMGTRIRINNKDVAGLKINLANPKDPANTAPPITADGVYFVFIAEYEGDTRDITWYTTLICIVMDPSTNPTNAIPLGLNGP